MFRMMNRIDVVGLVDPRLRCGRETKTKLRERVLQSSLLLPLLLPPYISLSRPLKFYAQPLTGH